MTFRSIRRVLAFQSVVVAWNLMVAVAWPALVGTIKRHGSVRPRNQHCAATAMRNSMQTYVYESCQGAGAPTEQPEDEQCQATVSVFEPPDDSAKTDKDLP